MIQSATKNKITNAIYYQIGWFICMYYPKAEIVLPVAAIVIFLRLIQTKKRSRELIFILLCSAIGYTGDNICHALEIIDITKGSDNSIYLLCLWLMFCTTLHSSLAIVLEKLSLTILLGTLAPVAYLVGQKIGRVHYYQPADIFLHSFAWALTMLMIYLINRKMFSYEKRII